MRKQCKAAMNQEPESEEGEEGYPSIGDRRGPCTLVVLGDDWPDEWASTGNWAENQIKKGDVSGEG